MAQYNGNMGTQAIDFDNETDLDSSKLFNGSSRSKPLDSGASNNHSSEKQDFPDLGSPDDSYDKSIPHFERPTVRVDACFGEWLSPGYYESIAPPPPSHIMLARAKAELLRSPELVQGARLYKTDGQAVVIPAAGQKAGEMSMDGLADVLPSHGATGTDAAYFNGIGREASNTDQHPAFSNTRAPIRGYRPPTPLYALSPSDSIPQGYVDHARDACVDVDFQWDSTREPQNWGDGGTYGEEWGSMHRRFRSGLLGIVSWYRDQTALYDPQDEAKGSTPSQGARGDDAEVVLVIVTHGAGANALIGGLTNQPALIDIGMASLTMATYEQGNGAAQSASESRTRSTSASLHRRSSSAENKLPEEYDMKVMASTEHLRAGADPLRVPQSYSPQLLPSIPESTSRRGSLSNSGHMPPLDSVSFARNSSLGSIRRTTVKSASTRNYSADQVLTSPATSSGLWGNEDSGVSSESAGSRPIPNDQLEARSNKPPSTPASTNGDMAVSNGPDSKPLPSSAGKGLWAMTAKSDSKRRWTIGEGRR